MDILIIILFILSMLIMIAGKIYSIHLSFTKNIFLGFLDLILPVFPYHIIFNFKKGKYILFLFGGGILIMVLSFTIKDKIEPLFPKKNLPYVEKMDSKMSGTDLDYKKEGIRIVYYDQSKSKVACKGSFYQNKKHGKFTSYYQTGEKWNEEHYEMGRKTSIWTYWTKEGEVEKTVNYNTDSLKQ